MNKLSLTLGNVLANPLRGAIESLRRDDRGVTAVEYGLLVALIAVVIIVAVAFLGTSLSTIFHNVGETINTA